MRVLGKNIKCEMSFYDSVSETDLTLFYRLPTVIERIKYSNEIYTQQNNKLVLNPNVRVNYALKIVTGIGENQFCDDNNKAISSDENSENYNPEWKQLIEEGAAELLMVLAYRVFEGITEKVNGKKTEVKETPETDEEVIEIELKGEQLTQNPFEKN